MTAQIPVGKIKKSEIKLSELLSVAVEEDSDKYTKKYLITEQGIFDLANILLNLKKGNINGLYLQLNSLLDILNKNNILLKDNYELSMTKKQYDSFSKIYEQSLGLEYELNPGVLKVSLEKEEVLPVIDYFFNIAGSLLDEIHTQSQQLGGNKK